MCLYEKAKIKSVSNIRALSNELPIASGRRSALSATSWTVAIMTKLLKPFDSPRNRTRDLTVTFFEAMLRQNLGTLI